MRDWDSHSSFSWAPVPQARVPERFLSVLPSLSGLSEAPAAVQDSLQELCPYYCPPQEQPELRQLPGAADAEHSPDDLEDILRVAAALESQTGFASTIRSRFKIRCHLLIMAANRFFKRGSWDEIHDVLDKAHAENRANGIKMRHSSLLGDEICKEIGDTGVMLVALDGQKIEGTAAIVDKNGKKWYVSGRYAYVCFDAVLPECMGKGVFKMLDAQREIVAKSKGYGMLIFDTHHKNIHRQQIAVKNGYKYVRFFQSKYGHDFVVMAKWLKGCPFSDGFVRRRYKLSKFMTRFFVSSGRINNKKWERIYKKIKRHYNF